MPASNHQLLKRTLNKNLNIMPYATGSVRLMQGLLKKILPVIEVRNIQVQTVVSKSYKILMPANSEGGDFFLKQA